VIGQFAYYLRLTAPRFCMCHGLYFHDYSDRKKKYYRSTNRD